MSAHTEYQVIDPDGNAWPREQGLTLAGIDFFRNQGYTVQTRMVTEWTDVPTDERGRDV